MDANTVIQLVSTLGFPIVACGALFWLNMRIQDQHKEETNKITQALNNNTNVMGELKTTLAEINARLDTLEREVVEKENK